MMRANGVIGIAVLLCGAAIGCGGGGSSGAAPTATPAAVSTATPSPVMSATPTATATPTLSVADVTARDSHGVAVLLNQTVTAEGIVTVEAGAFANNKLKIFIQSGGAGVMVFNQTSAGVPVFQEGDDIRVSGVVRQQDSTSTDVPLTGTVLIDIGSGSSTILSSGNPLPTPALVSLHDLQTNGTEFTGELVRVASAQKVSGAWPTVGSKSSQVTISDDGGTTQLILRFQKNTITQELVNTLNAIGSDPFNVVGIAVQNDTSGGGELLSGFEIWTRGAVDISPAT